MGSDATGNGSAKSGGFKSRVQRFLYSGDTKHVMAGMAIITLAFGVPWFLINRVSTAIPRLLHKSSNWFSLYRTYADWPLLTEIIFSPIGTKHSSHQDYMEKADKARRDRLSSGSAAT
ncbi:hypothetical protein DKX38_000292 [Salix brachista]|uniref:Uncharacterized protein n=1 Tax=Salix brachista TaxID=2182728 RepID=A0A5N5P1W2_9ROSI|nr:hypothetical protein DKX38_000292 [Salix brachista]